MKGNWFQTLAFIWAILAGTQPLQWTDDLDDDSVQYVCPGDDLHLLWNFTLSSGEDVSSIEWFYRGQSEELIGTSAHDRFEPTATFSQRVTFVPGAGIVLKQVASEDTGNYSVEVIAHSGSRHIYEDRMTVVQIKEPPSTSRDNLQVRQDGVAVYDNATDQWSIQLSCGHFTNLGQPPVEVVWQTPSGNTSQSTGFQDGSFHLVLPDPSTEGEYTCFISPESVATSCLPDWSQLLQNSTITVHECAARAALLQAYKTESKFLREKDDNLTQQVQYYSDRVQRLEDPICAGGNHTVMDDHTRDMQEVNNGNANQCDSSLTPGWYRFLINRTDAVISTSCVPENHCGTDAPLWLDLQGRALPAVGQEITVPAYGSYSGNCQYATKPEVTVRNCGPFFIYKLQATSGCNYRYCATTV